MFAAIDIGSNTVRLLIAEIVAGQIRPHSYDRKVTRLSGKFTNGCLNADSMERTLSAINEFSCKMQVSGVNLYRAVATEAVRRADNSTSFIEMVRNRAGIDLEIISGDTEARLTSTGVLSVMNPMPARAIIIDIGGGSTELICAHNGNTKFQRSYPLGVVRLCEEIDSVDERRNYIDQIVTDFRARLMNAGLLDCDYELVGTAGTVTTLSAINLGLTEYDAERINNSSFSKSWLGQLYKQLADLSISERETVPGMEAGRGDLIMPGIQILCCLSDQFKQPVIRVSDSGLLEGIISDLS